MSLTIIKAGIADTIQDEGRFGFQSSGINPGGAMDVFSARLCNCVLGKAMHAPVIEMHFPASIILFGEAAIISITGADFTPVLNDKKIFLNQPVLVNKGVVLQFANFKSGSRCYLSVLNNLKLTKWLNSYSTNTKAAAGGLNGRSLKTGDVILLEKIKALGSLIPHAPFKILPWSARPQQTSADTIEVIKGNEWNWLSETSRHAFTNTAFTITKVADRMGYRLSGKALHLKEPKQLVSSAVGCGTLQLLPSGQLILLMADHQTTGGYPRVANVISAHLPLLAQSKPGHTFSFAFTDIESAEQMLVQQFSYLQQVQHAAALHIKKLIQ